MNNSEVWKGWNRVQAPPDFEDRVFRGLQARLHPDPRARRARMFKWALSGSAACLLAVFTLLNLFVFRGGPYSGNVPAGVLASTDPIAVTERLNYGSEVRAGSEPGTVYLLEQVSDQSPSKFRY
jgi:hypothetical protein